MYLDAKQPVTRIGLISDTHGEFRPEIRKAFKNVNYIFHAGDIGKPSVVRELETIAPVTAVLGNIDLPKWYPGIEKTVVIDIGKKRLLLVHDLDTIERTISIEDYNVIIYGHTHRYSAKRKKRTWFINPGSVVNPRFFSSAGVAVLTMGDSFRIRYYPLQHLNTMYYYFKKATGKLPAQEVRSWKALP